MSEARKHAAKAADAQLQRDLERAIAMDTTYVLGGQDAWSKAFASVRNAGTLDELQSGQRVQAAMEKAYTLGFIRGYRFQVGAAQDDPINLASDQEQP